MKWGHYFLDIHYSVYCLKQQKIERKKTECEIRERDRKAVRDRKKENNSTRDKREGRKKERNEGKREYHKNYR